MLLEVSNILVVIFSGIIGWGDLKSREEVKKKNKTVNEVPKLN